MLSIVWTAYECAMCGWKPTSSNEIGARNQVEAHFDEHTMTDRMLFFNKGGANTIRAGYIGSMKQAEDQRTEYIDPAIKAEQADIANSLLRDLSKAHETVDHPQHYGGADNPYEAIKVIEAWSLDFNLGNCIKYICRAGKKPAKIDITTHADSDKKYTVDPVTSPIEDLKKAAWYLQHEIEQLSATHDTGPGSYYGCGKHKKDGISPMFCQICTPGKKDLV